MEPMLLRPWGYGTWDGTTQIFAMTHDEGRMLTLFVKGTYIGQDSSWFYRSSSKSLDASSDPFADGETLRSAIYVVDGCWYAGERYITWRVQDNSKHRFAGGDELTFPEGFFGCCGWPRNRWPLEEQTVTVWSLEEAQSARP